MTLLTASVTFKLPLFVVMMVFSICVSFVLGCIWVGAAKENKEQEETFFRGKTIPKDDHEKLYS